MGVIPGDYVNYIRASVALHMASQSLALTLECHWQKNTKMLHPQREPRRKLKEIEVRSPISPEGTIKNYLLRMN